MDKDQNTLATELSLPVIKKDLGFGSWAGTKGTFTTSANVWARALGWESIKLPIRIPTPTISNPSAYAANFGTLAARVAPIAGVAAAAAPAGMHWGAYNDCASKCNKSYADCMDNQKKSCP